MKCWFATYELSPKTLCLLTAVFAQTINKHFPTYVIATEKKKEGIQGMPQRMPSVICQSLQRTKDLEVQV